MEFVKWPKVQQIHNVRKSVKERKRFHEVEELDPYKPPSILYKGKVKLDGTNAAVRACHGDVSVQSRSRIITPGDDNMGFAAWAWESGFAQDLATKTGTGDVLVFGEWCGQGIQKRCSISKIDRKIFAVFAVLTKYDFEKEGDDSGLLHVQPEVIRRFLPDHPDVYVLPWLDSVTVDHALSAEGLTPTVELINRSIEEVEKCDPWVARTFGVEGLGEGIVYYPIHTWGQDGIADKALGRTKSSLGEWGFKAKGEEHQVVKQKAPVILDPEKVATQEAFVEKFVTQNRLEQGLRESCGGDADVKQTGNFLKWFGQDVKSESVDELAESGLDWKDVSKAVMTAARKWFQDECRKV